MNLLAILLLVVSWHSINAGTFNTIPIFKFNETELLNLISVMRINDKEKPEYCDVHLNYQNYYKNNGQDAAPAK